MKSIDSPYIKEIQYDDIDSFMISIGYGGELNKVLSRYHIYRGQFSDKYTLLPYALRMGAMDRFRPGTDYSDDIYLIASELSISQIWCECQLLREFYDHCDRNNLRVPESTRLRDSVVKKYDLVSLFEKEDWLPSDLWEVAALAQHYGIPTRLLDWTANFRTALYFAVIDYIKPCSIKDRLKHTKELFESHGVVDEERCEIWALDTKVIIGREDVLPLKLIRPPYYGNPNLAAQEGVFTLWPVSKPVLPMNENIKVDTTLIDRTPLDSLLVKKLEELKVEIRPYLYRISFPQKLAVELFMYLEKEGHIASKLFPGYGGVAQSIRETKRFQDELRRLDKKDNLKL